MKFKRSPCDFNSLSRLRTDDATAQGLNSHFNNITLCPRNELYLNETTSAVVKGVNIQSISPELKPIQLNVGSKEPGPVACVRSRLLRTKSLG